MIRFIVALLLSLPLCYECSQGETGQALLKGKLVFAHVLYRHGDRTIISPYPSDPNKDESSWPVGWGELTNIGKSQHYVLGQWLRNRYDSLLNRTYSSEEIYVRSTDVDRTLASALSNLAGMYPPTTKDIWNPNIRWQPIPVHTIPVVSDRVLAAEQPCPAYSYAYSAMKNSLEFQKLDDRFSYLYEYLTKWTGMEVDSLEGVQRINNTLYIEGLYNKTLPEWTKKVFPGKDMTYISDFAFVLPTYTRPMARLKAGPLVKDILDRFSEKAKGSLKPDRSLFVYSAHDITVSNLLNTLKLYEIHSPPYAACILLELRLDDKKNPFVSIFYKTSLDEPQPMDIPGCGVSCPLAKMYQLYKDILPEDWEAECKLSMLSMTYEEANLGSAMAILVAIIMVILILIYVASIYFRRKSYTDYRRYVQVA